MKSTALARCDEQRVGGAGGSSVALFGLTSSMPPSLAPRGRGLLLRPPQMGDFPQWAQLRESSRSFLTPWEPIWPSDDLTRAGFRRRLRRYAEDIAADRAYPFLIFRSDDDTLIGGVTLANVRRGIVQAGTIGYWTGEPFAGQGYMTRALRVLLPFVFSEPLGLTGWVPSIVLA